MVVFKLLFLSYMPTTLYFSCHHTKRIAMLYLVHKYKKKFESSNIDLTHSQIIVRLNRTTSFNPLAIFCGCTAGFVSDKVGNAEYRFSHKKARILV